MTTPGKHSSAYPLVRLGTIYPDIRIGGTPSRAVPEFFGGTHPWVSIADMDGRHTICDTREHLSESGVLHSSAKLVYAGSLLFSFKLTVGKVAFAGTDLYTNEAIAAFVPTAGVMLGYLRYVLPLAAASSADHNTFGARMLNKQQIGDLFIPLPSLAQQRCIVAKLNEQMAALDSAEQSLAEQHKTADALRIALIRSGMDAASHPDWRTVRVGQLYPDIPIGGTPPRGVAEYFRGAFPWVSIGDMNATEAITDTREHLSETGVRDSNVKLVRAGSLLFSFKLTVGKVAFAGVDLYTNEAIAAFPPMDEVDLRYLRYALPLSAATSTYTNTFGAHMLNKEKIRNLAIPLPPFAEQHHIVQRLDKETKQLETLTESIDRRATAVDALRVSLLRVAFSGEI